MKEVYRQLQEGRAQAAMERFAGAVKANPEQAPALGEKMAELLELQYRALNVGPVHEFLALGEKALPPDIARAVRGRIGEQAERTEHWMTELRLVRQERLIREARSAIVEGNLERAQGRGQLLIGEAKGPKEAAQLGRQLVNGLASLVHDKARAKKVVEQIAGKLSAAGAQVDLMAAFDQAAGEAARAGFAESDREWTRMASQATVALLDFLPARKDVGEPKDEEVARFASEMMAVIRAAAASGKLYAFVDAVAFVKEFSPTDPPAYTSLAGAEGRMFLQLGTKAKLTAVRGLAQIGEMEAVRRRMLDLARSEEGRERFALLAPAMGGLRHTEFNKWLEDALGRVQMPSNEAAVVEALGRIGSPEGTELILDRLRRAMNVRVFDPAKVRHARMLITSLGRIARSRYIEPEQRKRLVSEAVKAVGERELAVSWFAADQLFAMRLEELDLKDRQWAMRHIMKAMFMKGGGEAKSDSPLGFRAPMAAALTRLGKPILPDLLEAAQIHATNYSGGFKAFAEVMEKIGDERAVPVLETMLRTAFLFDDQRQGGLLEEQVVDAASGEMRKLTRDEVIHSLLFALDKVGGKEGEAAILRIADQVQSGQVTPPGPDTGTFLGRYKRERGLIGELSEEAAAEPEAPAVSDEELEEAMDQARGGLFAKAAKRVPAIATLGRSRRPEAAPVLVRCLGDKDHIVQGAAETALIQFLHPTPRPELFEKFLQGLFSEPKALKGEALDRLQAMVEKRFPKREPYGKIFRHQVARLIGDTPEAFRLAAAMKAVGDPTGGAAAGKEVEAESGADGAEKGTAAGAGPAAAKRPVRSLLDSEIPEHSKLAALDRKREYLEKRRAWIAAGKHGPPPEPPQ